MKKINLRDYYPYYTQDMIVEVPDEVALLLREYMLLEEAYRIRTYRYKAFYSLDRDEGIEREILQKPLNPAEIWEQRQMTELIYKGLSKLPVKQRQRIYAHFFLGMSKADIAKAEGTHANLQNYFNEIQADYTLTGQFNPIFGVAIRSIAGSFARFMNSTARSIAPVRRKSLIK